MTDLADILYQAKHLRQILFSELVANDFFFAENKHTAGYQVCSLPCF